MLKYRVTFTKIEAFTLSVEVESDYSCDAIRDAIARSKHFTDDMWQKDYERSAFDCSCQIVKEGSSNDLPKNTMGSF